MAVLVAMALGGCAHDAPAHRRLEPPVELTLIDTDGGARSLGAMRGRPLLLFVFATYDDASQLALAPLTSFVRRHPEIPVLGIAAQPDPERLLKLFGEALDLPFPLAYEPQNRVVSGESQLGEIPAVPSYLLLDAEGRIIDRAVGALDGEGLENFVTPVSE
ncbi:MAG: TlpA family protein disulfide reductase [Myxococcales bacterium]|nr:TlpA family protein disulfide reductase [Myxococcales bacterium]